MEVEKIWLPIDTHQAFRGTILDFHWLEILQLKVGSGDGHTNFPTFADPQLPDSFLFLTAIARSHFSWHRKRMHQASKNVSLSWPKKHQITLMNNANNNNNNNNNNHWPHGQNKK